MMGSKGIGLASRYEMTAGRGRHGGKAKLRRECLKAEKFTQVAMHAYQ